MGIVEGCMYVGINEWVGGWINGNTGGWVSG
jgi:hypothetical protein